MPVFKIARSELGSTVAEVLHRRLKWERSRINKLVQEGRVFLDGKQCPSSAWRVKPSQRLEIRERAIQEKKRAASEPVIRHVDADVVVVEKPAGLTTMRHAQEVSEFGARARRFLPPTLADILPALLEKAGQGKRSRVRAVHRLDRDTSGLVVFARTPAAESNLGRQFRAHTVERSYLAFVRGRAQPGRIESYLVRDRGDGRRGSSAVSGEGQRAVTHVHVLEELRNYTLVECRLETGRTHQVRIHLGESGTPICGERVYDRPMHGKPVPDGSGARRLALHAASLGLDHPGTGTRMIWRSSLPRELQDLLAKLRKAARG